jgi:hypothetical protein
VTSALAHRVISLLRINPRRFRGKAEISFAALRRLIYEYTI